LLKAAPAGSASYSRAGVPAPKKLAYKVFNPICQQRKSLILILIIRVDRYALYELVRFLE
jgi:hypothetical protein